MSVLIWWFIVAQKWKKIYVDVYFKGNKYIKCKRYNINGVVREI